MTELAEGWHLCECGCKAKVTKRFAPGHNSRRVPNIRFTVEDREFTTPCHIWDGATNFKGYGRIQYQGRHRQVHRVVWELENGPLTQDQHLDHLCKVRPCINLGHLEMVTVQENNRRTSRLDEFEVQAIRATREPQWLIAQRFGISRQYVSDIRLNKRLAPVSEAVS